MHHVREWLPFTLAAMIAVFVAGICVYSDKAGGDFEPVEAQKIELLTAPPYHVGQDVTIVNGVCNKTEQSLIFAVDLGLQQNADPLIARTIKVVSATNRPLAPGCQGGEAITGALPPEVTPGRWRIFANLIVMGPKAGQIQRLSLVSDEFEVRP